MRSYVVRNGLDMAFGYNHNQLKYFWGDMLYILDFDLLCINPVE
jgi:hypothetical protein